MTTQAFLQAKNKQGLCPLNVRYFHNTINFPVALGVTIRPEDFDKKKQAVLPTHPCSDQINYKIILVKARMIQVAQELVLKGFEPERDLVRSAYYNSIEAEPLPEVRREDLKPLVITRPQAKPKAPVKPVIAKTKNEEDFITLKDVTGLSAEFVQNYYDFADLVLEWISATTNATDRTREQRRTWLKTILDFSVSTKTSIAFEDFNLKFYSTYANWLLFGEHNLYNNTFGGHVKKLKTFLKWCELHKDITPNKQYKAYKVLAEEKQIENAYLDHTELNLLWNYETYREHKEKAYERTIDLCVFQNLTGLRFSDVTFRGGLTVELINGQKVLTGKTKKSRYRQTYQIPLALDYRIELLLEKYNYNFSTVMSDVEYNRRIKEVLKELYRKYRLHQKPYKIYRYKLDQQFIEEHYKYDLISSHSNRRGWVSWVYKELRLPEMLILKMMGSKSNTELKKYIALDSSDILSAINKLNLVPQLNTGQAA